MGIEISTDLMQLLIDRGLGDSITINLIRKANDAELVAIVADNKDAFGLDNLNLIKIMRGSTLAKFEAFLAEVKTFKGANLSEAQIVTLVTSLSPSQISQFATDLKRPVEALQRAQAWVDAVVGYSLSPKTTLSGASATPAAEKSPVIGVAPSAG